MFSDLTCNRQTYKILLYFLLLLIPAVDEIFALRLARAFTLYNIHKSRQPKGPHSSEITEPPAVYSSFV